MPHPGLSLDEECFLEHVAAPAFQAGAERGWWNVENRETVVWPYALVWIAAPVRGNGPPRYYFRFTLKDYPGIGPTATLWDPAKNARLDFAKWPKGAGDIGMAFRTNWNEGIALYAPWDRVAMDGHPNWPAQFPGVGWKPSYTIVHYLRLTHELLASDDYHGC